MVLHSHCLVHLPGAKWFSPVLPQPAHCQVMVSCCPRPCWGTSAAFTMFPRLLHELISERCKSSALTPGRVQLPFCPWTACTEDMLAWHHLPSAFLDGWQIAMQFSSQSLYSWFPPMVISSNFWACHCHRRGRWVQKWVRSAFLVLQILLHRVVDIHSNCTKLRRGFYFDVGVLVFLQTFSVRGKTCIVDTHVLERRVRLQSESLPFLLIMFNQVQAGRASGTLECPGEW